VILIQLKAETAALHARLDDHILLTRLMARTVTSLDYRAVLSAFAGFVPEMEALLLPYSADFATFGLDLNARRKTALLASDLNSCGVEPRSLPICMDLPKIATLAEAFGCLYVLEGSSLGGQVITKHLARHLNLGLPGSSYFSSYGADVGLMWREFRSALLAFVTTMEPTLQNTIIEAASATFVSLADWLDQAYLGDFICQAKKDHESVEHSGLFL